MVVVGGGYGGATVAKYLNLWSNGTLDITLVEAEPAFVSCPMSNLVLGGSKQMADLTVSYDGLAKRGVQGASSTRRRRSIRSADRAHLATSATLPYDRLVLSPGVDFLYDEVQGMGSAEAQAKVLHAWKAGRRPSRCAGSWKRCATAACSRSRFRRRPTAARPGPYERACQVAWYFKRAKPRSKVLILDGNEDVVSKKGLFMKAWNEDYKGIVEYRPELRAHRRRRRDADREVRDRRRREGGRAERDPAAARRRRSRRRRA